MDKDFPLSLTELQAVLGAALDYSEALWLSVFICTGAKLNEVLNMRVGTTRMTPASVGGREFPAMTLLSAHLRHYASEIRPLLRAPRGGEETLANEYLWLSSYARSPLTRTTVAQTLDRIGTSIGVDLTTVRFRNTRLAYLWHELGHDDPRALRRFAGVASHFEIVRRVEDAIIGRPEVFEDVMPGWEDQLIARCLPPIPGGA